MSGDEDEFSFSLQDVVVQLLKSELYFLRLRRVLVNGWNTKALTDFLVLDDVFLITVVASGLLNPSLRVLRDEIFAKALRSALRMADVRVHHQICRLEKYLRSDRPVGTSANSVLDAVYGPPKKGEVC